MYFTMNSIFSLYQKYSSNFFAGTAVAVGSVFIASCIVAHKIWWPMVEDSYKEEKKDKEYEYLLTEEYENLSEEELKKIDNDRFEELKECFIRDKTPHGEVVLGYNKDTESFHYYTENKHVAYKYLDTLVRKYGIEYNCQSLYVNTLEEFRKAHKKVSEDKEKDKKELEEEKTRLEEEKKQKEAKSVFATFKHYNRGVGTTERARVTKKYCILRESANRFSYKGSIETFENRNKEEDVENEKDMVDFATYKKMLKEKKT
jgi:hypothetical protein